MFIDIDQNTDEWLLARSGKVTGSAISKIMANYGKSFGDPAKKLAVDIALEQITGKHMESCYSNEHMQRGHEQEPIARYLYEQEYFCRVDNGGFFDNGFSGCSPDGLVGTNGAIEIKSVIPSVQYSTLKRGSFDPSYKWQLIFNLRETGREWIDYISFCLNFAERKKLIVHRVYAEDQLEQFKMIESRIIEFQSLVENVKRDIIED
jgi:hypothetical protein